MVMPPQHPELLADAVETVDVAESRGMEHLASKFAQLLSVPRFFSRHEGIAVVPILEEVVEEETRGI